MFARANAPAYRAAALQFRRSTGLDGWLRLQRMAAMPGNNQLPVLLGREV